MESNKQIAKSTNSKKKTFNFYKMKNGSVISCHGRPTRQDIESLYNDYNINYILTLQHQGEHPEKIKKACEQVSDSIKWHNFPLAGANMALLMSKEASKMILDNIILLHSKMKERELNIFVHCAAGIHRTGIILYTILRITGESESSAMEAIKQIRIETYRKCGDNRIQYAEKYLVQPLLKLIS